MILTAPRPPLVAAELPTPEPGPGRLRVRVRPRGPHPAAGAGATARAVEPAARGRQPAVARGFSSWRALRNVECA